MSQDQNVIMHLSQCQCHYAIPPYVHVTRCKSNIVRFYLIYVYMLFSIIKDYKRTNIYFSILQLCDERLGKLTRRKVNLVGYTGCT